VIVELHDKLERTVNDDALMGYFTVMPRLFPGAIGEDCKVSGKSVAI
jgi:hypothetical protein